MSASEFVLLSRDRFEVTAWRNRADHVRFDVSGIRHHSADGDKRLGGVIDLRLWRGWTLQFIAWTQLAFDIGQALNAAIWRRIDRASEGERK